MSLEIKKVYVDTRWRTSDSRSSADFSIELPRSFTVPDNVVAYIDDIVIPISFTTINSGNNTLYFGYEVEKPVPAGSPPGTEPEIDSGYSVITIDVENYTGTSFATALKTKLEAWGQYAFPPGNDSAGNAIAWVDKFNTVYDHLNNTMTLSVLDSKWTLFLYSDNDLKNGHTLFTVSNPKSLNRVLMLEKSRTVKASSPFPAQLDLHTTRNLYLTSSALGSYNSVSNFGNDSIIKKIPVKANYNEMLYHDSGSGFDYLDVTPRTLRYIDFKLVNSYFETIDLRGNHWSFSIIFSQK